VLAGAGTGKTRAIAHRIAYAVGTGVVHPRHVLAVTFTTRAAGELRGRLRQLGWPGGGLELVQARTFHSAALRQLTHFWPAVVGGRPPAVLGSKLALLTEAARELAAGAGLPELRDVASEIEWAKVTQTRPEGYAAAAAAAGRTPPLPAATVAGLFDAYERLRRDRHLIDFETVLELTAAILAEHRPAAAQVADRYRYFVVDEFQDTNPLQKLLLDLWAGDRDDVCVVGDPRQTIFSFTGATPAYLTGFARQYPHATVIRLVRNYRSTPQVVALANRLAGPARAGADPLVAQGQAGPEPELACYLDDGAEAEAVAGQAARLIADGASARQLAVLVRVNAATERFERAFAAAGVPCQVRGAERFFDRGEVRQAMGMLRAAAAAAEPGPGGAQGPGGAAGPEGAGPGGAPGPAVPAEVRHVLSGLGFGREGPPGRGAARERWESLAALAQLAQDICAARPGARLADVVAELAQRAAIEHAPAMDGVTLASLHAAKGLEWEVVFLPGLSEGNLPIGHARTGEAVAEELRLLYVGVTRARQRVCLSWALARSPDGRPSREPSRFLAGLLPSRAGRGRARAAAAAPGGGGDGGELVAGGRAPGG
jgi:DNA helicase-2/ATP-dependent DNA helicase PcrA